MFNKILEINHLLKKLPISDEEDLAAPETFRIHDKNKIMENSIDMLIRRTHY